MTFKEYLIIEKSGWIGVDLDGTLAHYDKWNGIKNIGKPVNYMVSKVKNGIKKGKKFKIFTARVADKKAIPYIKDWLSKIGLEDLEITNVKDMHCLEIWDDRAKRVKRNKGIFI